MQLSKNFSLRELTRSRTAERNGINQTPNSTAILNLTALCEHILQPVRDKWGRIDISSGYRSKKLNRRIGGSSRSQHVKGEAVDCEAEMLSTLELAEYIKDNLKFDQLILEFHDPKISDSGWVHVSYKRNRSNRNQILTAIKIRVGSKMKTKYLPGLVV